MESDYLVFWHNDNRAADPSNTPVPRNASVIRLAHPPHEAPRGGTLDRLIADALLRISDRFSIHGVVELANAHWSPGVVRDVSLGDGRVIALECTSGRWRVT